MALNVALAFFLTPMLLRHLGEERYGSWMLVSSLIGYYGLLEFGIGSALFRFVPLYRGQGDLARVGAAVNTGLVFYAGVGLVICATAWFFADSIAAFFGGGAELATLLRLVGLAAVFDLPGIILSTAIKGFEGFVSANLMTAVGLVVRFALLLGCVIGGYGLAAMGWTLVITRIIALILNYFNFRAVCQGVRIDWRQACWPELKALICYGGLILVASTANNLAVESPKQIVGKVLSLQTLGLFAIPLMLIGYYRQAIMAITRTLSPRFSLLTGSNQLGSMRGLFLRASRHVAIAASGLGVLLLTVGPAFIIVWTGKAAFQTMAIPLYILSAGTMVLVTFRLGSDLLFGMGEQKWVSTFETVEALGIVGLCILLSGKWGVTGAAFALAVPPLIVRGLWQTHVIGKLLGMKFTAFPLSIVVAPWACAGSIAALFHLLSLPSMIRGWISLIVSGTGICIAYGLLAFGLALTSAERASVLSWIKRRFNPAAPTPDPDRIKL